MTGTVRRALPAAVLGLCGFAAIPALTASAQGSAGASVRGTVTLESGEPAPAARVTLTNRSNGNIFRVPVRENGAFFFDNVGVGGPYSLEAASIGFRAAIIDGIELHVGDQIVRHLVLSTTAVHRLTDILVRGSTLRDAGFGGPAYSIPGAAVRGLPLMDRDFTGLFTMTTQASGSGNVSVSGQQFRFNAIQIDGAVGSDRFFAGTQAGDRVGAKSLSLEAIEEIRVLVAPFDVRQGGFSGGLINAVTKSGTNKFQINAFVSQSGGKLIGPDSSGGRIRGESNTQYGFTAGGPIVRDKLHFFTAADLQSQRTLFDGPSASDPSTGVTEATARRASSIFANKYGFSAGGPEAPILHQPNYNFLGKLSWQAGTHHQLAFTHTMFGGGLDALNRAIRNRNNRDGWELSNSGSGSNLKSFATRAVAVSSYASATNELIAAVSATTFRTNSDNQVPLFLVQADLPNTYLAGGSVKGAQETWTKQRAVELTDNFSLVFGAHTLTVGMQAELLHFRDVFFLGQWGVWTFTNLDALESRSADRYEIALPLRPNGPLADFRARELAAYFQDRWTPTSRLTLTAGFRSDASFFDGPVRNDSLAADKALGAIDTHAIPSGKAQVSPRLGFSYALGSSGRSLLRGGIGGFTGRPPYAWLTTAYSNTGRDQSLLVCTSADGVPAPTTDIAHLPAKCIGNASVAVPSVSYFAPGFKFQQAVKYVLGLDREMPGGVTLSLDFTHTRTRNSLFVTDANLKESGEDSEQRMMYGFVLATGQARPARRDPAYGQVFRFENRSADRSTNVSVVAGRRIGEEGLVQAAYSWSRTEDLMSLVGNHGMLFLQNSPIEGTLDARRLGRSARDMPHNLVVTAILPSAPFAVTGAFFFTAHSGTPYAFVANGDANGDGTQLNDLMYVPRDSTDVSLRNPQLYRALDEFIASNPCLVSQRGRVMSRNTCRNPAVTRLDARMSRDFAVFAGRKLQISADIFNLPNLLHHQWGVEREISSVRESVSLLTVTGWDTAANRPIYAVPSINGVAVFPSRNQIVADESRWKLQLGARYNFAQR